MCVQLSFSLLLASVKIAIVEGSNHQADEIPKLVQFSPTPHIPHLIPQ